MAEFKLNVPLISQSNTMSCWYASGLMVTDTPILPLMSEVYTENKGLKVSDVGRLASLMGMTKLASATHDFTSASMMATLWLCGAIFAAGNYSGYGHAIVITGADNVGEGNVYYNDPEHGGSRGSYTIEFFNEKRIRGLLYVKN